MDAPDAAPPPTGPADERVPLFGSWRAIYAAVIVSNLIVIALVALFSAWVF